MTKLKPNQTIKDKKKRTDAKNQEKTNKQKENKKV